MQVTGQVVQAGDASPPKGIPNAQVAVEYGGLYVTWCDLSHASPYYVFGAYTDANGNFTVDARQGILGFHAFANGYYYSRAKLDTSQGQSVTIALEPLPPTQAKPTITGAAFDKPTVVHGSPVTLSATIATWAASDPLSDENVLVEPKNSWGLELDPPSTGSANGFPDGLWKRTFQAPQTPGTYTYSLSATTNQCVTSDQTTVTLTVQ